MPISTDSTSSLISRESPSKEGGAAYKNLLEDGFRLANFLLADRPMALEVLSSAIRKLRTQRSREKKRSYWRAKFLKSKITRIIRSEEDMLQWLIYLESTPYEEEMESTGRHSMRDMVIRYIKTLVQVTTAMSSFYVNVGFQRLLYAYRTSEAQQAYEWLTNLYPNPEAYRTVKAAVMNQLKCRFGDALKICEAERGERKFDILKESEAWQDFVLRSLTLFVPWSTRRACSIFGFDAVATVHRPSVPTRTIALDSLETSWCHAFIHPPCYAELTKRAGLEAPQQRLVLPLFHGIDNNGGRSDCDTGGQNLTESELANVMKKLEEDKLHQQNIVPGKLRVVADGQECGAFDVADQQSTLQCELPEGTKLLEFWAGEVLFATHWIEYTNWEGVAGANAFVALPGGKQLCIEIEPTGGTDSELRHMQLRLRCQPVGAVERLKEYLKIMAVRRFYAHPKYAVVWLALLASGWATSTLLYRHYTIEQEALIRQLNNELSAQRDLAKGAGRPVEYTLVPDELRQRGLNSTDEDAIRIASGSSTVVLNLPVGNSGNLTYRAALKAFLDKDDILNEGHLTSWRNGNDMVVSVNVPCNLLQNSSHYVLDLYSREGARASKKIHTFRFVVSKNLR